MLFKQLHSTHFILKLNMSTHNDSFNWNSSSRRYLRKQSTAVKQILTLPLGKEMVSVYPDQINYKTSIIAFQKFIQSFEGQFVFPLRLQSFFFIKEISAFLSRANLQLQFTSVDYEQEQHSKALILIKKLNEHSINLNQTTALIKVKFIQLYEFLYRLHLLDFSFMETLAVPSFNQLLFNQDFQIILFKYEVKNLCLFCGKTLRLHPKTDINSHTNALVYANLSFCFLCDDSISFQSLELLLNHFKDVHQTPASAINKLQSFFTLFLSHSVFNKDSLNALFYLIKSDIFILENIFKKFIGKIQTTFPYIYFINYRLWQLLSGNFDYNNQFTCSFDSSALTSLLEFSSNIYKYHVSGFVCALNAYIIILIHYLNYMIITSLIMEFRLSIPIFWTHYWNFYIRLFISFVLFAIMSFTLNQ